MLRSVRRFVCRAAGDAVNTENTGDEAEAHRLARQITAYWERRGRHPHVWVEERFDGKHGAASVFVIRSNITGGIAP